jgi:hypothetical protein
MIRRHPIWYIVAKGPRVHILPRQDGDGVTRLVATITNEVTTSPEAQSYDVLPGNPVRSSQT